jgi:hypothetical protein
LGRESPRRVNRRQTGCTMTDLTDRMRTCAAAIEAGAPDQPFMEWQLVYRDAAALLIEAAGVLEQAPAPLGEPMEIIPPVAASPNEREVNMIGAWSDPPITEERLSGTWVAPGGPLPTTGVRINPRACPKCDSRAIKTVYRGNPVMLGCPVCGERWEWAATAAWNRRQHDKKPPGEPGGKD